MKVCNKCGKSGHTSVWYQCIKCKVFICGVCSYICNSCSSSKDLVKSPGK